MNERSRSETDQELLQYIRALPKAELHAHLHGCVSDETIRAIGLTPPKRQPNGRRNLEDCFDFFAAMHEKIVKNKQLEQITDAVIQDFAKDNVRYLELRTTPRPITTRYQYIITVIRSMHKHRHQITTRLVICIDRARPVSEAEAIFMEAAKFGPQGYIVGVDLCGDPRKGKFEDFLPILTRFRDELHLKVTVHCGEVENPKEVEQILDFKPDRVGHALYVPEHLRSKLPIVECCPTSNMMTLDLPGMQEHPVLPQADWDRVVICTDDSGLFDTTLSQELFIVSKQYNLSHQQIARLVRNSFLQMFSSESVRKLVYSSWGCKVMNELLAYPLKNKAWLRRAPGAKLLTFVRSGTYKSSDRHPVKWLIDDFMDREGEPKLFYAIEEE